MANWKIPEKSIKNVVYRRWGAGRKALNFFWTSRSRRRNWLFLEVDKSSLASILCFCPYQHHSGVHFTPIQPYQFSNGLCITIFCENLFLIHKNSFSVLWDSSSFFSFRAGCSPSDYCLQLMTPTYDQALGPLSSEKWMNFWEKFKRNFWKCMTKFSVNNTQNR